MGPYVIFSWLAAGSCGFASFYYGWLWFLARRERFLLLFAVLCATSTIQCRVLAGLSSAETAEQYQHALDLRTTISCANLMLFTWALVEITGVGVRRLAWILIGIFALVGLCNLTLAPLNGVVDSISQVRLPWGEMISTAGHKSPVSPLLALGYAGMVVMCCMVFAGAWRMSKTDKVAGIVLGVTGVLLLLTAMVGSLVDFFHAKMPYSGSPIFVAWLLLFGLVVAREYRKRIDQLTTTEHRLAGFFATSPDAIFIVRLDDGKIIEVNSAFVDLFGWRSEEALGRTVHDLSLWGPRDIHGDLMNRLCNERTLHVETMLRRRDGSTVLGSVSCGIVVLDGRECAQIAIRDITELRRTQDQLNRNERLTALGTMAGGVAHDFNNVVASIKGNLDLMRTGHGPERAAECMRRIGLACQQMVDLTGALTRFARQGSDIPDVYDAHEAIRTAVTVFKTIGRRTNVDLSGLSAGTDLIRGSRGLLQNAILNLCINSRDAMAGSGDIVIVSKVRDLDQAGVDRLKPYEVQPGQYLSISVIDQGAGMDAMTLQSCFTPFFTTKGESGTGLGLNSVRSAAIDHHGAVTVESAMGRGTTFTLWLPLSLQNGRQVTPASSPHQ